MLGLIGYELAIDIVSVCRGGTSPLTHLGKEIDNALSQAFGFPVCSEPQDTTYLGECINPRVWLIFIILFVSQFKLTDAMTCCNKCANGLTIYELKSPTI